MFFSSLCLLHFVGTDLFPDVDTGELDIRVALDENARLEESEKIAMQLQDLYKRLVPEKKDYYASEKDSCHRKDDCHCYVNDESSINGWGEASRGGDHWA